MGKYHHLYLKNGTLLLADVFEKFREIWLEIYKLDLPEFLSATRLVWQAALKKTKTKLKLLTDIDMLLMVQKELVVDYVILLIDMLIINI